MTNILLPFVNSCSVLIVESKQQTEKKIKMLSKNTENLNRILNELKVGSVLIKRKSNGEKYSRHFFLDEYENFISYHQSEKVFAQPRRCKYEEHIQQLCIIFEYRLHSRHR
jgi:hypothetical protein